MHNDLNRSRREQNTEQVRPAINDILKLILSKAKRNLIAGIPEYVYEDNFITVIGIPKNENERIDFIVVYVNIKPRDDAAPYQNSGTGIFPFFHEDNHIAKVSYKRTLVCQLQRKTEASVLQGKDFDLKYARDGHWKIYIDELLAEYNRHQEKLEYDNGILVDDRSILEPIVLKMRGQQ